ncbi:LOW QUALITY PROTEIN: keratin-associated protein 25-1, partial [Megaptera novaeangliae]
LPNQNRTWLLVNFPETCGKPSSYQPSSCVPKTYEISGYPSTTYCVSRPRATGCFPISSHPFCQPSIYNRPQNYMSSSCLPQKHLTYGCKLQNVISCGYRPLNFASITCHPLKYLSYDRQPLGYESSSFRPLDFISNSVQPVPYIHSSFQPAFSSFGTWQSPFIR